MVEKILIKLVEYDSQALKKTRFTLGEIVEIPYKICSFRRGRKKFVQTRYQQSKERFCFFKAKTAIFVKQLYTKSATRGVLQKSLFSSYTGFCIKQHD